MSPRGVLASNYRGRGYSKDLPTWIADDIRRRMDEEPEGETLRLTPEVLLLDNLISEQLQRRQHGLISERVNTLHTYAEDILRLLRDGKHEKAEQEAEKLKDACKYEQNSLSSDREVLQLIERRRVLADTDRKRIDQETHSMTSQQALEWVAALVRCATEVLKERHPKELGIVMQNVRQLMKGGAGPPAGAPAEVRDARLDSSEEVDL